MPVRVLILDDSAFVRKLVNDALSTDREIEVIGAAAIEDLTNDTLHVLDPDVIVLDSDRLQLIDPDALERLTARRATPWVCIAGRMAHVEASGLQAVAAMVKTAAARP